MFFGKLNSTEFISTAEIFDDYSDNRLFYDYYDEYLRGNISLEIAQFCFTNRFYIDKLSIFKAYIICCIENQTDENDLFAIKLKHYKAEFASTLTAAKDDVLMMNAFNCPLSRG